MALTPAHLSAAAPVVAPAITKLLDIPSDHYRTKRHKHQVEAYRDVTMVAAPILGALVIAGLVAEDRWHDRQLDAAERDLEAARAAGDHEAVQELEALHRRLTDRRSLPRRILMKAQRALENTQTA
jgi:hypothetical protein